MPASNDGFILRLLKGLWRSLNFGRRLLLNIVFVIVLVAIFNALMQERPTLEPHTALVIHPQGRLVEQYSSNPSQRALAELTGDVEPEIQLRDLLSVIETAAEDDDIERIVLVPDQIEAGISSMRELGQALDRFRNSGKEVVVVSEGMDQVQYYLAVHANEILLDPDGAVLVQGLANYRSYYRDALDKLGVKVHLIRVGEYKSAAEPFILNAASEESKQADRYWMGGLWNELLSDIAALRKLDPKDVLANVEQFDQVIAKYHGDLARLALERGLVDALLTRAEVRERLAKRGAPDDSGETFRQVDWRQYLAMHATPGSEDWRPQVGVIVAQGEIVQGEQGPDMVGATNAVQLLRHARTNDQIQSVVLRIDSPGGDAYASEQIRREVELIQAAGKPVIVSMGDVAASGGYWIAMNADEIWAQPTTITGSIGIYGLFVKIPDSLEKLGIHTDGVATTAFADAFDMRRPMTAEVESALTQVLEKGYRDFIGKVAAARGKQESEIDAIARGRVWSGAQAKARGLVDKLGGLEDAIAAAAARAGIADDYGVDYIEPELSAWERFALSLGRGGAAVHLDRWSGLAEWSRTLLGQGELRQTLSLLQALGGNRMGVVAHCFCRLH